MTAFDFIVLLIVGIAATGGFMRGFVQEVLSVFAWILAILAIHNLHTPLTSLLTRFMGFGRGAELLAFALLLLIPYAAMKLIASRAGAASRGSIVGPVDRMLGFGFGAVKGGIITVVAFSLLVLGYDSIWGVAGRPAWITTARTYPIVDASAEAMVQMIEDRRAGLRDSEETREGA